MSVSDFAAPALPKLAGPVIYDVDLVTTGFFSGTLNPRKLVETLNKRAGQGWQLTRTIHETKRVFFIFKREAHFMIFERPAA
jgi:hypothetical protein